jgi:hypothetical protein
MHRFCLLLFKDVFFFIHTLFITACDTLSLSLSLVLLVRVFFSLYTSFSFLLLTDRLLFFLLPNFTSSLFSIHFSRLLKQWARAFVPCAILFSSLRIEDDIAASFSGVFLFVSSLFSFSIYIQIHILEH